MNDRADALGFHYYPNEERETGDRYHDCLCGEEVTAGVSYEPE